MNRVVWQTTLLFTCLGILWIVITDQLILWFDIALTPSQVLMYQTAKGIGFVLLVGLLLFFHLRRTTRRLEESERAYKNLFEGNPQPALIFDTESLQILAVNDAAIQMYGYTRSEFMKLTIRDLRPPEEVPRLEDHLKPIRGLHHHGVWVHRLKDGTNVRVEVDSQGTEFGGRPARMAVINDLTEFYLIQERAELDREQIDKLRNSLSILNIRLDEKGKILETNPAYRKHFPLSHANQKLEILEDYVLESDREILRNCLKDAQKKSDRRAFCTICHTTPQGDQPLYISWEINWSNHTGAPAFHLIGYDVTEKYQSREELERVNRWLRLLLSSITDGFFTMDADLHITYANAEFQRLTGKSEKDLIGTSIFDTFPNARETGVIDRIEKVIETKKSDTYETHSSTFERWYRGIAYPFEDGVAIFFRDITEEHKMREQLAFTEKHLHSLTQGAQNRIWSIDTDLNYLYLNEAYKQFFQQVTGRVPKVGDSAIAPELSEERAEEQQSFYTRALKGESFEIEYERTLKGMGEVVNNITFNPIVDEEGNVKGVGCISLDITMRKKREKLLRKQNQLLREIAFLSSHQTRRPVANIMGLVEIMAKDHPDYVSNEPTLQYLMEEAKDLDNVIRHIVQKVTDLEKGIAKEAGEPQS